MTDPVMADLDMYLTAMEDAEDRAIQKELEKNRHLRRDITKIISDPIETSEKIRRLVSLVEYEIQEAKDESY